MNKPVGTLIDARSIYRGWGLLIPILMLALGAGGVAADEPDEDELLTNPGFEEPLIEPGFSLHKPEGWVTFSSLGLDRFRMTTELFHSGDQALHVASQHERGSFQGIAQTIPVEEGVEYEFSVYAHNDPEEPLSGTVRAQMSIEWRNNRGEEIRRQWGPEWNRRLPRHRWESFSMKARAPRDAVVGVFGVTQYNEQRSMDSGAFYMDSFLVLIAATAFSICDSDHAFLDELQHAGVRLFGRKPTRQTGLFMTGPCSTPPNIRTNAWPAWRDSVSASRPFASARNAAGSIRTRRANGLKSL